MLLSELMDARVRAPDGANLGRVVDVRFRRAARRGRREGELELIALIVSPHSRLSYYGYERGDVNAPAAINAVVRWMHRRSSVIPWECVARIDEQGVVLATAPPDIPLDPRRSIPEED